MWMQADALVIDDAAPGFSFALEFFEVGDASLAEALTRPQRELDLRLIEPAAVLGRVVNSKALPDVERKFFVEDGEHGAERMGVEIVEQLLVAIRLGRRLVNAAGFGERSVANAQGMLSSAKNSRYGDDPET